jgi:hypothetical protein
MIFHAFAGMTEGNGQFCYKLKLSNPDNTRGLM